MSFKHGKSAEVTVNSVALGSFCDSSSLSLSNSTGETTTFGQDWQTFIAGLNSGSVSMAGKYDPTATTGPVAVFTGLLGAAAFPVVQYPGGNEAGQVSHTFNALVTGYEESAGVADVITFSANLQITGPCVTAVIGA